MNEKSCKHCHYYQQHYVLDERKLFRVYCGHCTFARAKNKRPDSKACENFLPGTADAQSFATREYLSKALLQYVLSLPLLPDIEDMPAKKELP